MINHFRTILLNEASSNVYCNATGWAYVDPDFEPISLPEPWNSIHNALFKTSRSDIYYRLYVVSYLMKLLHNSSFENYVTDLDPRITYSSLTLEPYPTSVRLNSQNVIDHIIGDAETNSEYCYVSSNITVSVMPYEGGPVAYGVEVTDTRNLRSFLSNEIINVEDIEAGNTTFNLVGNLKFVIKYTVDKHGNIMVDTGLDTVDVVLKPIISINEIYQALAGTVTSTIFADVPKLFNDLWLKSDIMVYRIIGALLAYVYSLDNRFGSKWPKTT